MTQNSAGAGVLICIPTFNERENLPRIVPAVLGVLPAAHVLVIDDNSPDGTGDLADALAAADPRVQVLHRVGKEGLGKAYLAGFAWGLQRDYQIVIEFDADFSHDPSYLPIMVARFQDDRVDVVVGSRRVPGGGTENWGLGRRAISLAGSLYSRGVLGVKIRDLTGGFNAFRRSALMAVGLEEVSTSGYGFQIEMKYRAIRAGLNVVEMPIIFKDRVEGVSKMSTSIFWEAMMSVARMRMCALLDRTKGRGR